MIKTTELYNLVAYDYANGADNNEYDIRGESLSQSPISMNN